MYYSLTVYGELTFSSILVLKDKENVLYYLNFSLVLLPNILLSNKIKSHYLAIYYILSFD